MTDRHRTSKRNLREDAVTRGDENQGQTNKKQTKDVLGVMREDAALMNQGQGAIQKGHFGNNKHCGDISKITANIRKSGKVSKLELKQSPREEQNDKLISGR